MRRWAVALLPVGDTEERLCPGRNHRVVQAEAAKHPHPGRHQPLAARFVAREPSAVEDDDMVAETGEQECGCGTGGAAAHHRDLGFEHESTLAERSCTMRSHLGTLGTPRG